MIAEDENLALRHDHVAVVIAPASRAVLDVVLVQQFAVDEDLAVAERDLVSRQPDDALDVRLVRLGWRIEHNDVSALRRIEGVEHIALEIDGFVGVAVDQEHLPVIEIGGHALAIDTEVQHDQPYEKENECRQQERFDDLANGAE